ncbi:MAG: hypothetical protein LKM39_16190 [Chiayiivirga sp.]|jgi:hypothetical protein|nr:hypothetical protein [Chiayiivirga sp.]
MPHSIGDNPARADPVALATLSAEPWCNESDPALAVGKSGAKASPIAA